jgi:hypothetical protein
MQLLPQNCACQKAENGKFYVMYILPDFKHKTKQNKNPQMSQRLGAQPWARHWAAKDKTGSQQLPSCPRDPMSELRAPSLGLGIFFLKLKPALPAVPLMS